MKNVSILGKNENLGAIAASYNELQGIKLVDEIFESVPGALCPAARHELISLYASDLILYSCVDILERSAKQLGAHAPSYFSIAQSTVWLVSLLSLAERLHLPYSPFHYASPQEAPSRSLMEFLDKFEAFDQLLAARIRQSTEQFKLSISGGAITDVVSILSNNIKLLPILVRRVAQRPASSFYIPDLNAAYQAQFGYRLRGDTYFSQFRVLHQVPELLAREALRNIDEILAEQTQGVESMLALLSQLRTIGDSVLPPSGCLSPSEYHRIRRYLGQTSGSDSDTLRRKLFGSSLRRFEMFAEEKPVETSMSILNAYRSCADRWRSLHLALPRNVLGAKTRSLIGSSDAIAAVLRMHQGAAKKASHEKSNLMPLSEESANLLVELTGQITRVNFPEVEARPSRISKDDV